MRGFSHRETVQTCGARAVQEGGIALRVTPVAGGGLSAGWAGLATCGSPWVCPVCSAKIAARRMLELSQAVEAHLATGGRLALLTVTMRHRRGQRLAKLWDGMSGSWRRFVRSGSYRRLVNRLGVEGYVRATEVTHGANGWHVHFHVLYFLGPDEAELFGEDTVRSTRNALVGLWTKAVDAQGFSAVDAGQDFRLFLGSGEAIRAASEYLVKTVYTSRGVGAEVAGGAYKTANRGNRTPFGIAADLVAALDGDGDPDPEDVHLWAEWDKGSTGRRQLVWSRGLRERLGLEDVLTDEEAAAAEVAGIDVLRVPPRWVRWLTRSGRLLSWPLAAAETCTDPREAALAAGDVLTAHGIPWELVELVEISEAA